MANVSDQKAAPPKGAAAKANVRQFKPGQKVTLVLRRQSEIIHGDEPFPAGSVIAELTLDESINTNWIAHAISQQIVMEQK